MKLAQHSESQRRIFFATHPKQENGLQVNQASLIFTSFFNSTQEVPMYEMSGLLRRIETLEQELRHSNERIEQLEFKLREEDRKVCQLERSVERDHKLIEHDHALLERRELEAHGIPVGI
jgi:uncharacterized protein YlxW (UPF0749 family)